MVQLELLPSRRSPVGGKLAEGICTAIGFMEADGALEWVLRLVGGMVRRQGNLEGSKVTSWDRNISRARKYG